MSLISNIDHLARPPGVVAILVDAGAQQAHRGEHREALRLALLLRDELNADELNVVTGEVTIVVHREPDRQTAAVAVKTGHAIRKSLRRMLRKAARTEDRRSGVREILAVVIDVLAEATPGPGGL